MDSLQITQTIKEIEKFLEPYQPLWSIEVLNNYPNTYEDSIEEMTLELEDFDPQAITDFLNGGNSQLSNQMNSYVLACQEISHINQSSIPPISILKNFQLSSKKKHELSYLIPHIDQSQPIIDFAGGTGHLSEQFHSHTNQKSTCLDKDADLLEKGRKRVQSKNVAFEDFTISPNFQLKESTPHLLALHNCGDLSDHIIDYFKNTPTSKKLYNIGCCYHKCSHEFGTNLKLGDHAKTLAIRSSYQSSAELEKRIQVKKFRYTFELFLKKEFGILETSSLRSSTQEYYKNDFAFYASHQLRRINLNTKYDLNSFFSQVDVSRQVKRLVNLGFLRLHFSRILEKLIIFHRAKKLSDISNIEVHQVFDFKISPRNILLSASK